MLLDCLIHFINKVSPVVIQTPWVGAVGNCAEEIYFGLLRAQRQNKKVLLLFPHDLGWIFYFSKRRLGVNRELTRIASAYRCGSHDGFVTRTGALFITGVYSFFRLVDAVLQKFFRRRLHHSYLTPTLGQAALWNPDGLKSFSIHCVKSYNWKQQLAADLPVRMPGDRFQQAQSMRLQMGLPQDAWFVCLHVREGGYYGHKEGPMKTSRNSSINNYLKAVKLVSAAGGWLVRIGDKSMTPLPAMERVIDYPHSRWKSDLMDIYLIQECRFYIGAQSGPWSIASLFQKPVLTPNMNEWIDSYPERKGDLGLIKHIYSRSRKRFLSLKECLELFSQYQYSFDYGEEYELHENTPDEISDLVKEYLEQPEMYKFSPLQQEWDRLRIAKGYELIEQHIHTSDPKDEIQTKYHLAARLEGCAGSLGKTFLARNWEYNERNTVKTDQHLSAL